MLDALSDMATRFGQYLTQKASPETRVPKGPMMVCRLIGDPTLAFVRVMRALQLAISLAIKIEDDIAGLKAGILPSWAAPSAKATPPKTTPPQTTLMASAPMRLRRRLLLARRIRRRILRSSKSASAPKSYAASSPSGSPTSVRARGFTGSSMAPSKMRWPPICADLGLKPDWSLWTEDGFPPPPGGRREDWIRFFVPEGDVAPGPSPGRTAPSGPPRERVRDPLHLLDPPTRRLHEFLAAAGIEPRPPPRRARGEHSGPTRPSP